MPFRTTDLDTKIKDIDGRVVFHEKTLREQIIEDETKFDIDHVNLDILDEDELNIHVGYLEHLHAKELLKGENAK